MTEASPEAAARAQAILAAAPRPARRHKIPVRGVDPGSPGSRPGILAPALGRRYGRERLLRFAALAGYPSLRAAAKALGTGNSQLSGDLRKLEQDLGGELLVQGTSRPYRPMQLTALGEQVVAAIGELDDGENSERRQVGSSLALRGQDLVEPAPRPE